MSNFFNPLRLKPVNLFDSLTVAAASSSDASVRLPTYKDSKLHIYIRNDGASTDVSVTIYSTDSETSTHEGVVEPFVLGASGSGSNKAWIYLAPTAIPAFMYAGIKNNDSVNSAIITVTVDRYR